MFCFVCASLVYLFGMRMLWYEHGTSYRMRMLCFVCDCLRMLCFICAYSAFYAHDLICMGMLCFVCVCSALYAHDLVCVHMICFVSAKLCLVYAQLCVVCA